MRPPLRSMGRSSWGKKQYVLSALLTCAFVAVAWRPRRSPTRDAPEAISTLQVYPAGEAAAAVTAAATIHGFVQKQGPADVRNWHSDHKEWRATRLQTWMGERERLLAEGQTPPPLPIYTGCQVFVNHLYKIVYLRHAKTASSSLFCHFGGCKAANSSEDSSQSQASTTFELLKVSSEVELDQLWKDYFVVSFARNPYQRAISSYRMMMRQLVPGGEASTHYGWNDFCADPTGFADVCMSDEYCKKKGRNFVYVHIQPQQECMVTADGGWAVDFIGRVEHIDEDLGIVLNELEQRRSAEAPPVKPLEGSLQNVNGRGCNESAAEAGHSVAREQYCDPLEYYQRHHSVCFPKIRHHYHGDSSKLEFGLQPVAASS